MVNTTEVWSLNIFLWIASFLLLGYMLPLYLNVLNILSISALLSIIGAFVLYSEANSFDHDIVSKARTLTDRRDSSVGGIALFSYLLLILLFILCIGIAIYVNNTTRALGLKIIESSMLFILILLSIFLGWRRLNRSMYDIQTTIRNDLDKLRETQKNPTHSSLRDAKFIMEHSSNIIRRALRTIGFSFLLTSGSLTFLNETWNGWLEHHHKNVSHSTSDNLPENSSRFQNFPPNPAHVKSP